MPEWTREQKQVIESRGQNLLVSAAAGSGKTAVLVQRIMEKILDPGSGIDLDRLLVVTFTNAAAASLREKIRIRLEEEAVSEDPDRAKNAMRQLSLLAADHIETIDRFCREIVLDHADALEIDPSFRIADEGELRLLETETASRVIEACLEDPDEAFRAAFMRFSRLYAPGRSDDALEDVILPFYHFSMSHEFPRMWRHDCARLYRSGAEGQAWMEDLVSSIRMRMEETRERLLEALALCTAPGGPYQYAEAMEEHASLFDTLCGCNSMQEYADLLKDYPWPRPGNKVRGKNAVYVDPLAEAQVKEIRQGAKDVLEDLTKRVFFADEDEIDAMRLETAQHMDTLVRVTDRFEERFAKEKAARRIADFSDVAHWALRVLICVGEDGMPLLEEDGSYRRTRPAEEYAAYFQEIYIDEYQDSNRVQEILLQSIARPGGRFMVGDMKQSIYRFRMADTGIFLEKERSYSEEEHAAERRIDLHRNFRSMSGVLDAVNLIFRQIMRSEIGGVAYTARQHLRAGFVFPPPEDGDAGGMEDVFSPELILAQKEDVPDASSYAEAEAVVIAKRILDLVGSMPVYDKEEETWRPAAFGDITILLRTASGWAETFSRVLDEYGIPNRPDASTGYFDAVEVRTVLSYLNVLDNPRQDIPLAASLRSQIGGLEDRELALIRAGMGKGSLYEIILRYMEEGEDPVIREKLCRFVDMTRSLRSLVKDTPIHLLLWKIFDVTGYEDLICAQQGGRQKKANLSLLTDMAMAYGETSYRGLFHFVRYIEKLRKARKDIGQASPDGRSENLVRIMTMHKSKGLEFPVVFVSGLNKQFNLQDARSALVMHERLGAGLDWRGETPMAKMPCRIRSAIAKRIEADAVGEELRVLYVAMTRAEQKLILTGCVKSLEACVKHALVNRMEGKEKLSLGVIGGAGGMLDWILAALARHGAERDFFDSGRWEGAPFRENEAADLPGRIRILTGQDILSGSAGKLLEQERRLEDLLTGSSTKIWDPALHRRLECMMSGEHTYPGDASHLPGKLSVSEIKHAAYEAELKRLMEEEDGVPYAGAGSGTESRTGSGTESRMGSGTDRSAVSGAAMGSAYHLILADWDFAEDSSPERVQALLETMRKCDRIQKEEASGIEVGKIVRFLHSGLGLRMKRAAQEKKLWREQPFVVSRRADEIRPEWSSEEQILIQGIIDAFFLEEDQLVLVDYKTDRAKPGDEQSLVRRYRVQFALYADALERLLQRKVKEAWLYSLSLQKEIPVDLHEDGE